jgi:hypothetical protein
VAVVVEAAREEARRLAVVVVKVVAAADRQAYLARPGRPRATALKLSLRKFSRS